MIFYHIKLINSDELNLVLQFVITFSIVMFKLMDENSHPSTISLALSYLLNYYLDGFFSVKYRIMTALKVRQTISWYCRESDR